MQLVAGELIVLGPRWLGSVGKMRCFHVRGTLRTSWKLKSCILCRSLSSETPRSFSFGDFTSFCSPPTSGDSSAAHGTFEIPMAIARSPSRYLIWSPVGSVLASGPPGELTRLCHTS